MKLSDALLEIVEAFQRKKNSLFLYTLFLFFSFALLSISNILSQEYTSEIDRKSLEDTETYKLVDSLIGETEEIFLRNLQSTRYLHGMYHELSENPIGSYQVMNSQGVWLLEPNDLGTEFIANYENIADKIDTLKKEQLMYNSLQVNEKTLYRFKPRLIAGRSFQKTDYQYKNNIPILLGNDYSKFYSLGDKIPLSYLFKNFEGEVIGFIEQGERLTFDENTDYLLDTYIILPFIESIPQQMNEEDFLFFQRHLLNGINGYYQVANSLSQEKLYMIVNEMADTYQVGTIQLIGNSPFHISSALFTISKNRKILNIVVYFSIMLLMTMTVVFSYLELHRDKKNYQLHLLFGATNKDLRNYFLIEKLVILSIVFFLNLGIVHYLGKITFTFLFTLLGVSFSLFLIFFLTSTITLKKWRMIND
ncbi:hypothetical protein ACFQOY_05495 [Enterococcus alcedinis]|uniref:Uncharacterized protein n=1 Tax=Enterococcus alcedinis TaxID=1274384 RepID=A0A917JG17_9ENTE|nr:hypothetical protein [Enterococcus alcedinis]MBP2101870.1 preprotein translocase subunit SecG [Enterococcus alcedinis]GGI65432.1 hypothetical protein GCM10011482_10860 [Enterococcus alcedinis]